MEKTDKRKKYLKEILFGVGVIALASLVLFAGLGMVYLFGGGGY